MLIVALALGLVLSMPSPLAAQYGGISGLFVTPSPTDDNRADFDGLGCEGGVEVVLYWPGLDPTPSDPTATQSVPGRILAVTTSVSSDDPLLDGTFSFPNVLLPDVEPGVYEVRARCGDLDLSVLVQIDADGVITTNPDPDEPVLNPAPPGELPITGGSPSRLLSIAGALVGGGIILVAASRRRARNDELATHTR